MFRVRVFLQKFLILLHVTTSTIIGKMLMILFPKAMKRYILKLGEKSRMNENQKFSYENWGPTFFSFKYLLFVLKVKWKRLEDEAYEGHPAPNTPVMTLNGEARYLSDFMQDGWAFKNNIVIKNHRSLEDRKIAAQLLQKKNPLCPVVLDTMENLSSSKYAAMPERLYLLQGGKVIYKGGAGPWNYHPQEIRAILEKMK